MKYEKEKLLKQKIQHIDIKTFNSVPLIDSFDHMAFQSRNLARACEIYDTMLKDKDCTVILCLTGSLVSAGMKKIIVDLIKHNMVDIIVSTGAIVVDQDFFEGLGFYHYRGFIDVDDNEDESEAIHFIPEVAFVHARCPKCGSPDFEIMTGRGVSITLIKGEK